MIKIFITYTCFLFFNIYVCVKLMFNHKTNPKPNSMKKTIYSFALGVLASTAVIAQDSTSTKKDEGKFTISGYIDSYYNFNLTNLSSSNVSGVAGTARAFDKTANQFALGLVQTKFAYVNKKSELMIDLVFGPNAALGNFGNVPGLAGYINPVSSGGEAYGPATYLTSMAIKQAYFKYNITDKLSFTVGQFGTHIGYEVIDAPINYNYSLSNLFNNGPFYHVGGKLNYAFSDNFGVMVGVVNNWDNLYDYKTQKSGIAQIFVSPTSGFNIYLNWIGGYGDDQYKIPNSAQVSPTGPNSAALFSPSGVGYTRNLFDLTTGYQLTDKFYIGLNAAYGFYSFSTGSDTTGTGAVTSTYSSMSPSWYGAALYANYQISSAFGVGIRAEHFDDKNKVRYIATTNTSLTLTTPITLADGHLIIKPEVRYDMATDAIYISKDGAGSKNQATFGVAFIYKY
jgi:hypothetical protein